MSAIEKRAPDGLQVHSFGDAWKLAQTLADAGDMVPKQYNRNPSTIMAAIIMGAEMGFGPMQSLRSIHVVEGKPEFASEVQLALMIQGGVKHRWVESTDEKAVVELTRAGFEPHVESFTIEEAKQADLSFMTKSNRPGMWTKYPKAMLRARCISSAGRAFCPDLLRGTYASGEISGEDPIEAHVIEQRVAVRREPEPEVSRRPPIPAEGSPECEALPAAQQADAGQARAWDDESDRVTEEVIAAYDRAQTIEAAKAVSKMRDDALHMLERSQAGAIEIARREAGRRLMRRPDPALGEVNEDEEPKGYEDGE